MFAIRARRKVASERDFLDAVEKVVRQGTKFSSTYVAMLFILHFLTLTNFIPDLYTKCITRYFVFLHLYIIFSLCVSGNNIGCLTFVIT